MDIPVEASKMTGSENSITVWDAKKLNQQRRGNAMWPYLQQAIDEMGKGSKTAQGLNAVLTSVNKMIDSPTHRLYLLCTGKLCVGLIKVGHKKLFIRTKGGQLNEIDPLCVLDFYVHESQQRSGYGRQLYDTMLEREEVSPSQLGYDRPSVKFLSFLRKHFGLSDYVPQSNNFVVFTQYFERGQSHGRGRNSGDSSTQAEGGLPPTAQNGRFTANSMALAQQSGQPFPSMYQQQQQQRVLKSSQQQQLEMQRGNSFKEQQHSALYGTKGRSPSPYGGSSGGFSEVGRRPSQEAANTMAGGRAPLPNQIGPPRSQLLNSAPTVGLSSSCYPGGGHQPRPAGSQQISRMQLANTQRPGVSTQQQHRGLSPTRSGADYDILTGDGQPLGSSVGGQPAPQPAPAAQFGRPMGRQSTRHY